MPQLLINTALILVGILGLFVMALMLFSYKSNVFVNIYLVLIFTIGSLRNVMLGLVEITNIHYILDSKLISPFYLIVIPSLYLYFESLIKDCKQINIKHLFHFIYPALNLVLSIGQVYFNVLQNQIVEDLRFISLVLFFATYMVLSFNVLYKCFWQERLNESVVTEHYQLMKNWTSFLYVIAMVLLLRILFSIYSEKMSNVLFQAYNFSFLVVIPWLLIYGKILINPEILYGYPNLVNRLNTYQNPVNIIDHVWIFDLKHISNPQYKKLRTSIEENVVSYIYDIENSVVQSHPFRNPKFSFSDFAKMLNMPASHLIYIFKYHAIVTFVEYKNYCRIKDALALIDEGVLNTITLEGLARKVGFSSYNSFFTSFKKQMKLAPKEYLANKGKIASQQDLNLAFN